jgi:adenosylhomocysteinase
MPLLQDIERDFSASVPFKGLRISLSIHLEAKTAYLCKVLQAGGAQLYVTGSNPLSTQDDIAAALVSCGVTVFALHGTSETEYNAHIQAALSQSPHIIIDDGGDLMNALLNKCPEKSASMIGGCEETTTGILRLKMLESAGKLPFPMIAVNDAKTKYLFDNRYGTGQSVWDGINRTTNLIVAGKQVVVAGYGWCGKGIAMRAKGFGAKLIITEVDPVKAIEAHMDGFAVMPMREAAKIGDIFITATGCAEVINAEHYRLMKDGAIVCNAGHFDVEADIPALETLSASKAESRPNITAYTLADGRMIHLLAQGRLVNLAAGDGHPAEIMDMSFALQALSARYLAENAGNLSPGVIPVPEMIDRYVAKKKLSFLSIEIDTLTDFQKKYLYGV